MVRGARVCELVFDQSRCVGVIADGAVRDVARMRQMSFPAFARGMIVYDSKDRQRVIDLDVPVEIDEAGILHAEDNARLNGLSDRIQHSRELPSDGAWVEHRHDLIVANILRPILMEYAQGLSLRLAPHGTLILSGLVATDVPDVGVRFSGFLDGYRLEVFQRGDWRALVWRKGVAP